MVYFTIGADVEVFGKNPSGEHVSLCGKIGGTKEAPKQVSHLPKGFMVQEDNVSLEFNIPPADRKPTFVDYIQVMEKEVKKILSSLGYVISKEASVSFDQTELTHPNALVFGCEPDYNAWTKKENKKPKCDDVTLRTAGGHIHVGTQEIDMLDGIRAMDLFLGVPSVLLDNSPASIKRRQMYGKAGAMRPKPYGFEYRVLSNFWMFDKLLTGWVFNNTYKAMEWAYHWKHGGAKLTYESTKLIQQCINTGDESLARDLVLLYNIPMPKEEEEEKKQIKLGDLKMNLNNLQWIPNPVPPPTMNNIHGIIIEDDFVHTLETNILNHNVP